VAVVVDFSQVEQLEQVVQAVAVQEVLVLPQLRELPI
jgi:hypothetical protein